MSATVEILDPLLPTAQAEAMLGLCERFGSYGSYAEDATNEIAFAPELAQRHDAAVNFVRTGGRFGRREPPAVLAARTNYFRETYAYDGTRVEGIEPFLEHEGFVEAARRVHGRPLVVPNIVYANLLVPGQELTVHTDVPEFRGANRKRLPQWLMVVMHHSRLFDAWRIPIATGIAYFGSCQGGELAYYPDGPQGAPRTLPNRHDTAAVLDTDSVFHGVDRVVETQPLPPLRQGMKLVWDGRGWEVRDDAKALAHYAWDEVRFSVSWKAYCFEDERERRKVEQHEDDLGLPTILETLEADLRARGGLAGPRPTDAELALRLIDEYVRFPEPTPEADPLARMDEA
jgi:hypothetical protein